MSRFHKMLSQLQVDRMNSASLKGDSLVPPGLDDAFADRHTVIIVILCRRNDNDENKRCLMRGVPGEARG